MTWGRLDDNFADHPKIVDLSSAAFRTHVEALCYCGRQLTDGKLPRTLAHRRGKKVAQELVQVGVWDYAAGTYEVHDYLKYNPSRAHVLEKRQAAKERMNKARSSRDVRANKQENAQGSSPNPTPTPISSAFDKDLKARQVPRPESNGKPRSPTETQGYLMNKLVDRDSRWDELWGLLTKLNAEMTRPVVTTALQHLVESDSSAERPPALLVATCKQIREEQAEETA